MTKRVLFVVDNLKLGGVTKVLSTLLQELAAFDLSIDLMVLHYYADMQVQLPETVRILKGSDALAAVDDSIGALLRQKRVGRILKKLWLAFSIKTGWVRRTIRRERRVLAAYDVEVAFGDGFPYLYTAFGDTPQKIAWMHSDVLVHDHSARYFKTMKQALARMDACVAVSRKVGDAYEARYGVSGVQVIPNLLDHREILRKAEEPLELPQTAQRPCFVTVGRLCHAKHYDRLIRVAKRLRENGRQFTVCIIGDGEDREELAQLITDFKLTDTVFLLGRRDNPYPFVRHADAFLLCSRYEGLPTVLYEAILLKTPCISTEVAGAREIVDEAFGTVCENSEGAFFAAVDRVLEDPTVLKTWAAALAGYVYDTAPTVEKLKALFL